MSTTEIRETLEKQLQLLSKRSHEENLSPCDLAALAGEMVAIAKFLDPYR